MIYLKKLTHNLYEELIFDTLKKLVLTLFISKTLF